MPLPSRVPAAAHVFVDDIDDPVVGGNDLHHLARVLRLRPGQTVTVAQAMPPGPPGATNGLWRPTVVPGGGLLESGGRLSPIGDVVVVARPSRLTVGIALTKGDRLDWAVQKVTELGIDRIVLVAAEHSVVRWDADRAERHVQRLALVVREAAMQSRQVNVASIEGPLSFAEALAACGEPGSVAVADTSGQMTLGRAGESVRAVLIGPEGGFSAAELDLADRCGASRTLLPGGVLRAETAAVVAGCLLSAGAIGYAQSSPL